MPADVQQIDHPNSGRVVKPARGLEPPRQAVVRVAQPNSIILPITERLLDDTAAQGNCHLRNKQLTTRHHERQLCVSNIHPAIPPTTEISHRGLTKLGFN